MTNYSGVESVGKAEARGGGTTACWVVQEGSVSIHLVPNEQGTTVVLCQAPLTAMPMQTRPRGGLEGALGGRAISKKEAEEEGDLLEAFFYRICEFSLFLCQFIHRPVVPDRYAIKFVAASDFPPAVASSPSYHVAASLPVTISSTDHSVVSSASRLCHPKPCAGRASEFH